MTGRIGIGKVLLGVVFFGFLIGPVAAEWQLSVPSHPNSEGGSIFTSDGKNTVLFVEIKDETGNPILPQDVTDASDFYYKYNKSSGSYENLSHFEDAFWYAEFDADLSKHGVNPNKAEILFEAQGDKTEDDGIDSGGWQNASTVLQVENYTVDIENAPETPLEPEQEVNISVNVSDREGIDAPGVEDVYVTFKNSTYRKSAQYLDYNSTSGLYEDNITVPPSHDQDYLMTVIAQNKSHSPEEFGAVSRFVNTTKNIDGKIENLTYGVGCKESEIDSVAANCEPGGSMDLSFNVTGVEVDNVTLSAYKVNRTSGGQVQLFNNTLAKTGGLYDADVEVPEINTTAFLDQILVKIKMKDGDRHKIVESVVEYSSIDVTHVATGSVSQGGEYQLEIQARKPISFTPYEASGVDELRVNVTDSNSDLYENFTREDFVFDQSDMVFETGVDIGQDAVAGGWGLEIFGSKYSQTDSGDSGFSVISSDASFDVNDTEFMVDERGEQQFSLEVENMIESNITLEANLSAELAPLMNISEDGRFNVTAGETDSVNVTVNMTDLEEDITGELNLTDVDTQFMRQSSVTLATPGCKVVNGSLCGTRDKWINVSVDSRNSTVEELEIFYTAGEGNSTDINVTKSGPVSQFLEINKTEYNITDNVMVDLYYTAADRGNFTGNIKINAENGSSIVYNTSLDANVTELGSVLSLTNSTVDLGVVPEGSSGSFSVEIENSAGYAVENLIARSGVMDVSLEDNIDIQGGTSETVKVNYENLRSLSEIEITGSRSQGSNVSVNFLPSGETIQDYSEQTENLDSRIDSLSPVSDANLSDTLQQVGGMIDEINNQWSNGNYIEARDTYQRADELLTYVANNKGSSDDGGQEEENDNEGGSENDGGSGDDGGSNTDQGGNQQTQQQQSDEGGGLPIIPIVVVLVILVVIGVVVYESYIPEEGDPLYGVLGEE